MRRSLSFAALMILPLLFVPAAAAPAMPSYKIAAAVPLGPPDRWDFVTYDGSSGRVFVSHRTEVTVVDSRSGKVVGRVEGIAGSHGVVTAPALGKGYADASDSRTVTAFDLKTLKPVATMAAGEDADAMAYDPISTRVFVMDADGMALTAIDAAADKTLSTMPLGGKPESAVVDRDGHLFINLVDKQEILRVGTRTQAIEARYPITDCEKPHGLAIDAQTHRLFSTCENGKMMIVDSGNGKVVAELPIGKGSDAADFDPVRKLVFSSNGDGTLSVIAERGPDDFVALGNVPTAPGARTMAVDPAGGRIFLVAAKVEKTEPPRVPGGHPHYLYAPGTAMLLILEPAGGAKRGNM